MFANTISNLPDAIIPRIFFLIFFMTLNYLCFKVMLYLLTNYSFEQHFL